MFRNNGKFRFSISSLTLVMLFCLNDFVNGQNSVKGLVLNMENQSPVSDATVYINGTTRGTSTDSNGLFELKDVSYPCQLMVRQVGYEMQVLNLDNPIKDKLAIFLKLKSIQLSEVKINGLDRRAKNVELFNTFFLGTDEWGKKAKLMNDSVLVFNNDNDTLKLEKDSNRLKLEQKYQIETNDSANRIKIYTVLSVSAKAPLIIDLPSLGYKLYVDLVSFYLLRNKVNSISEYLGYYYLIPYNSVSKRMERQYKKNRLDAYYESRDHFCRMFYRNELRQNGYLLVEFNTEHSTDSNVSTDFYRRRFVDINELITYKDEDQVKIIGQKGKTIYIYDFYNYSNKPIDLTNAKKFDFSSVAGFWQDHYEFKKNPTSLHFLSDTCIIRSNGSIPDNNIMFGGKMSRKKAGATIPTDYQP